jgi:hypothetical protein
MKSPTADIIVTQCLFEPRMIDFEGLKQGIRPSQDPGVSEEIIDIREPRDAMIEKYVRNPGFWSPDVGEEVTLTLRRKP